MASTPDTILWRLVKPEHAPGIDGVGAERWGGRWNSRGRPAVYCASSLSLAVLEYFVHIPPEMRTATDMPELTAVQLAVPTKALIDVPAEDTKNVASSEWCRRYGDEWLESARSLGLVVPSVIIFRERNVVINPHHPDAAMIRVAGMEPFRFDPRMGG